MRDTNFEPLSLSNVAAVQVTWLGKLRTISSATAGNRLSITLARRRPCRLKRCAFRPSSDEDQLVAACSVITVKRRAGNTSGRVSACKKNANCQNTTCRAPPSRRPVDLYTLVTLLVHNILPVLVFFSRGEASVPHPQRPCSLHTDQLWSATRCEPLSQMPCPFGRASA